MENTTQNSVPAAPETSRVLVPEVPAKKPRGFAALSPEERSAIAGRGGRAAHKLGTAHKWTPEKASEAGKKGGTAAHRSRGRQKAATPVPPAAEAEET